MRFKYKFKRTHILYLFMILFTLLYRNNIQFQQDIQQIAIDNMLATGLILTLFAVSIYYSIFVLFYTLVTKIALRSKQYEN